MGTKGVMRRRAVGRPTSLVSALLALGLLAGTASAQEECSTTSYAGPPLPKAFMEDSSRVWPKLPDAIFFNLTGSTDRAGAKATTKLRENVEKGLKDVNRPMHHVPAAARTNSSSRSTGKSSAGTARRIPTAKAAEAAVPTRTARTPAPATIPSEARTAT